jgi:hypothetical protein
VTSPPPAQRVVVTPKPKPVVKSTPAPASSAPAASAPAAAAPAAPARTAPAAPAHTAPAASAPAPATTHSTYTPQPTYTRQPTYTPQPTHSAPAATTHASTQRAKPAPKPKPAAKSKPKPRPKPKPVAVKPKPKPHPAPPKVVPLGIRFALPGPNVVVQHSAEVLPAALAFLALVAASGGFLGLVYQLRRELARP